MVLGEIMVTLRQHNAGPWLEVVLVMLEDGSPTRVSLSSAVEICMQNVY
jgi:hypothetical protein